MVKNGNSKSPSSESMLATIGELSHTGYWEFYFDTNMFWGNETAYHVYGLRRNDTGLISFKKVLSTTKKEDRARFEKAIKNLMENEGELDITYKIYKRSEDDSKSSYYINSKARIVYDKEKQIKKAIGIVKDITAVVRHEKEIIRQKEKAERSEKQKGAFLANMSHEIRTPMNAIIGFSELLSTADLTPLKRSEFTTIIRNKGKLLLTLIDDIIELSKLEAGKFNITYISFSLDELLRELVTQFRQYKNDIGKQNLEIRLKTPETEGFFSSDPGRIQQVFNNLIVNAIRSTETGYVEIGYYKENELYHFYVKDTGYGISEDQKKYIFKKFWQIDDHIQEHKTGLGLGLAITREIIEALKGKIWVDRNKNKGTVFTFTLPDQSEHVDKDIMNETPDHSAYDVEWKDKVILVVEDEEVNFKFLETVLHDTGAKVLWAQSGNQAIELVNSLKKLDLILMDIKMPGINGFETTREIRKIHKNIPIIAQTALTLHNEKRRCIEAGCDDYISKPIDIHSLIDKINKQLNMYSNS